MVGVNSLSLLNVFSAAKAVKVVVVDKVSEDFIAHVVAEVVVVAVEIVQ